MKRVIVSVTNDLVTDNRVHRVCSTLLSAGYDVILTGRKLSYSASVKRNYSTRRMRLVFNKGPLFYAEYNIRLFFSLLFSRFDILLANDLDTLPANYLCSRLRGKTLVYDSHEYFTEVPELINRKRTRNIWKWFEKKIVPKLIYVFTVSDSLAAGYMKLYNIKFEVIRNVPFRFKSGFEQSAIKADYSDSKQIIYQGALNKGRGIEKIIRAMKYVKGAVFLIAGDGDISAKLRELAHNEGVDDRVVFQGRIPAEELPAVTVSCHLGISFEEDMGLSYRYSLPNKIFDYIQAEIPVLCSGLDEQRKLVEKYNIGICVRESGPEELAEIIQKMLSDEELRKSWSENLKIAAEELCWEKEQYKLTDLFGRAENQT